MARYVTCHSMYELGLESVACVGLLLQGGQAGTKCQPYVIRGNAPLIGLGLNLTDRHFSLFAAWLACWLCNERRD